MHSFDDLIMRLTHIHEAHYKPQVRRHPRSHEEQNEAANVFACKNSYPQEFPRLQKSLSERRKTSGRTSRRMRVRDRSASCQTYVVRMSLETTLFSRRTIHLRNLAPKIERLSRTADLKRCHRTIFQKSSATILTDWRMCTFANRVCIKSNTTPPAQPGNTI